MKKAQRAFRRVMIVLVLVAVGGLVMTRVLDGPGGQVDGYPQEFEALCTRVIDGDTIVLLNEERVRYIGMDTPEMRPIEPWAVEATEANRELVERKMVRLVLDVQERDQYGRLLAYVYVNDTFVNAELVRRGLATVVTYPPNVRHEQHFLELQREAREAGRGMWSEPGIAAD